MIIFVPNRELDWGNHFSFGIQCNAKNEEGLRDRAELIEFLRVFDIVSTPEHPITMTKRGDEDDHMGRYWGGDAFTIESKVGVVGWIRDNYRP